VPQRQQNTLETLVPWNKEYGAHDKYEIKSAASDLKITRSL